MTVTEFKTWARSRGWVDDKWGHMQKTIGDKLYRFKISSTAVRYEVKVVHVKVVRDHSQYFSGSSEWMRVRSGYFKDLSLDSEGKLKGLR